MALPIDAIIDDVVAQLPAARLVIQAPPGAGKSTRLPLALLASGATVVVLQPRRLAAINIAHYLAEQLHESVGETVGYLIRGEQKRSAKTRLLIMTEGILVRWLQDDPELSGIDCVVFDEFHERNLYSDLSLALLLESLPLKPQLSLLIMSATLPAEPIQLWLQQQLKQPVRVLKSAGRQYPLTTHYRPAGQQPWLKALSEVITEAYQNTEQGLLVFVPGVREINYLINVLQQRIDTEVLPLHGRLSLAAQHKALSSHRKRRIIVATNVAETSLTIAAIDGVVDSGRQRVSRYRPQYSATQLQTRYTSRASAEQRAGRAGRQGPGQVYRLWSQADEHGFSDYNDADIATQDLTQLVAEVCLWGSRVDALAWLTPPSPTNTQHALTVLTRLQIVCGQQLTQTGRAIMLMGGDIRQARIAYQAGTEPESSREALAQALATLEEPDRRLSESDFITRVEKHHQAGQKLKRWHQRYRFWQSRLNLSGRHVADYDRIAWLLLFGFTDRIAQRVDSHMAQLVSGARVQNADMKGQSKWLLALDVQLGETAEFNRLGSLLPLSEQQLENHPAVNLTETTAADVARSGKPRVFRSQRIGKLLFHREQVQTPATKEQINAGLRQWLQSEGLEQLNWSPKTRQYWYRLYYFYYFYESRQPLDIGLKPTTENLVDNLNLWAEPFWQAVQSLRDLQRWDPLPALQHLLDYQQQQTLQQQCPAVWQAPSGRLVEIIYPSLRETEQGVKPKVQAKLQELFGEPQSPKILAGQQNLMLDLLSPAGRLLQRTEDLASFWVNGYAQVRKEMRGRYPKHPWPENPVSAVATRKTNRQLK